jgi:hypothetical protein
MELDCAVHNRRQWQSCAFAFSAAQKKPGVRRAKDENLPERQSFAKRINPHSRETFARPHWDARFLFALCA